MSPLITVCLAAVLTAGPIRVGPAMQLPKPSGDTRDQVLPDVAFDGQDTFLVVWQQGRNYYQTQTSDLYCARVSADGKLIDRHPLAVCTAAGAQMRPRVAFADGVFLIVWQDLRGGKDFDVYAARVTAAGKVMDRDGFRVAGGAHNQALPDVAPGGGTSAFLVAWQDLRPGIGYELRAARIGSNGRLLDARGVAVATAGRTARGGNVVLARTRGGWLVFWRLPVGRLQGGVARLTETGGALVTVEIATKPLPHYSGVLGRAAGDGQRVLYAGTTMSGRGRDFRPCTALLFAATGIEPRANPNPPIEAGSSGWNTSRMICLHVPRPGVDGPVDVAFGGGVYVVVVQGTHRAKPPHRHQVFAARLAADGKRIDDPKQWRGLVDGKHSAANPAVAAGKDGRFLVVHESDAGPGKYGIHANILDVHP